MYLAKKEEKKGRERKREKERERKRDRGRNRSRETCIEGRNLVNASYITIMVTLSRDYICNALVAYLHATVNGIFQTADSAKLIVSTCLAPR